MWENYRVPQKYRLKVYGSEGISNFNPVHVFLHFGTFGLEGLQLILASKLSELEQFENRAAIGPFTYKIEFSSKWLRSRAKCKKGDPLLNSILLPGQHQLTLSTFSKSC